VFEVGSVPFPLAFLAEVQAWLSIAWVVSPEFLSSMYETKLAGKWSWQISNRHKYILTVSGNITVTLTSLSWYLCYADRREWNSNEKAKDGSNNRYHNKPHAFVWKPKDTASTTWQKELVGKNSCHGVHGQRGEYEPTTKSCEFRHALAQGCS
jgi:hypothetical protein